ENSSSSFRAAWAAAAQASATAKAEADSTDASGMSSYCGRTAKSASAQRPAAVSERREVHIQVALGTQRSPSQTRTIDAQASDDTASVGQPARRFSVGELEEDKPGAPGDPNGNGRSGGSHPLQRCNGETNRCDRREKPHGPQARTQHFAAREWENREAGDHQRQPDGE